MKKSIIVIFLVFISLNLFSKNYYIDAVGGIDSNNGNSIALAWKTLTKVNATTFIAGDSILFKSGCTWTGQLYPKGSGAAGNPIVINKYGIGNLPYFDGAGMTGTGVLYLYNQQYWEINNLEIVNDAASAGDRRGVRIEISNYGTANHIYVKGLNVHNIKGSVGQNRTDKRTGGIGFAIVSVSSAESHFNDILVDGCTIQSCDNEGILFECVSGDGFQPGSPEWTAMKITNAAVRNNSIYNISKNAMVIRLFDGGVVEHNVCYNTANGMTGNTIYSCSCLNTVFQYNEGYLNNSPDYDGSLYDADLRSSGTICQYNYSHDNAHGLFWNCTVQADDSLVCRYNISQNDHGIIFCVNYPVMDINIYNNTVYIPANQSPIIISERNNGTGTRNYSFNNNIIYNNSITATYGFTTNGYTRNIDYNCFFGNHPSTEPADAHKVTADPLFVNPGSGGIGLNTVDGYKLKTGSPCINSGIYIPKNGGKDYWGNTVGIGKPDMGAYESPGITASVTLNSDKPTILIGQNKENPGILNLNISGTKISDTVSVKITSMNGKTLFNQKYQPLAQILIDTKSVLIKGVYIVSVDVEDKTEIRKIVIK